MNKDQVTGTWNKIKGKAKEEVGHATGNTKLEGKGVADQVKGNVQKGVGNVKDAVKKGVDTVLGH